jgi:cytochrome c
MRLLGCTILLGFAAFAQNAPDAPDGKKLFEKKCSICHASDTSERRIGPSLKGVKDGHLPGGRDATREIILKQLNDGGNGMPVFRELLSDAEKESVARYVLTL